MLAQFTVLLLLLSGSLAANEKNADRKKQPNAEKRNDNVSAQHQKRGLYGVDPVKILSAPPLPSFASLPSYASSTALPWEHSSLAPILKSSPYPEVIIKPSSTFAPHLAAYDGHIPISSTALPPPAHSPPLLHGHIKEITVTKEVPVPFYVHVEKKVPYPVYIQVPQPYPVPVEKHVPYEVRVPVEHPVPKPYPVPVEKHIPYPVKVPVDRPYPVHVPVEKPVPYPVRVLVDRPVAVPRPYPVKVAVPIPVPYEKHHYHDEEEIAHAAVRPYPPHYPQAAKYSPFSPIFKRHSPIRRR